MYNISQNNSPEAHDVEPRHDVVMLALENDSLLLDSITSLLGREYHEYVFDEACEENDEELVRHLATRSAEHVCLASRDEGDDANEGGNEAHDLHPVIVD